ncbi:MAG: response regulator [Candidatus Dadabacteria bacterium]
MTMNEGLPFRILLVDDDADDRMIIDDAFLEIGYAAEVKKFKDAHDLFKYMDGINSSLLPSLIVLDNTLPRLSASDVLKILKEDPQYNSIPVVVYSNKISPTKKEELLALGAYDCVEKEVNMKDVIEMAKRLRNIAEQKSSDVPGH